MNTAASQRIIKIRRDYNTWVANETLEDYALRFTPRSFRKWSEFRIANTALGAVSFLALEAIGGALAVSFGFTNALWAILCVSLLIFLTGLPISYYSAKYGVDMDLLTRGAGFGYIGSTITSLIYASFTFIFFALEASIMAYAVELYFGLPIVLGYVACSLVIIPLVTHGVTFISRLQSWSQPVWIVLLVLPYVFVLAKQPDALSGLMDFSGRDGDGSEFNFLMFGAAATIAFSLIAQIGEQVDFLRFLPEKTRANRVRWWSALLLAGPGWILMGAAKMLGGALLAYLAIRHGVPAADAIEPTHMYLVGFGYVFSNPAWVLGAVTVFVIVSQVKINVTNAYAGSLAWSNFFARLTHTHPGRVVWLIFNVLIAVMLMQVGVFKALEHVLSMYSLVAIAWIGAVVSDLVINKPLGLSPPTIEFKRAHLYDINPVGVGSMLLASMLSLAAVSGFFGAVAHAAAPFIALGSAMIAAPAIAFITKGRYYIARADSLQCGDTPHRCVICENVFENEDMAHCPAYKGAICSLCCSLDVRCNDRCKTESRFAEQSMRALRAFLPEAVAAKSQTRIGHYLIVFGLLSGALAIILVLIFYQELAANGGLASHSAESLRAVFIKLFSTLLLLTGVGSWWLVLTNESRRVAQTESERQTDLLLREIDAHRQTDVELQQAKDLAEAANLAKSRYVTGMSHELRTPLNSILGYAQILQMDQSIPAPRRDAAGVIRRSGEHLLGLIDGLLDIARIEAGKMRLESDEFSFPDFIRQIISMFAPQAAEKGLEFKFIDAGRMPPAVRTDQKRLRQILINLLGNAVKFTSAGSITLRLRYAREIAIFEIEDTGVGIAPEDVERIFFPFERATAASLNKVAGTGLGLSISGMLTQIMGGDLSVASTPGKGSTFTLKMYLPQVHVPQTELQPDHQVVGYLGERKRILLVDDQASQRNLLRDMLAPIGFEIVEADSAASCLAEAASQAPDLLLLDISMPGTDGWQICNALRSQGCRMPIIMVSANAFVPLNEYPDGQLHNDFVVKPVSLPKLLARIRQHLPIQWVTVPEPANQGHDHAAESIMTIPPPAILNSLLELGSIGYIKGILEKLDAVDRDDPAYGAFTADLRVMIRNFRINQYINRINEVSRHDYLNDG